MKVGTNEFLLKWKTIAFYFNFDREEKKKKKKKSLFTFHVFRRLKKKLTITNTIKHIITVHITQGEDNLKKKKYFLLNKFFAR